MNPSSKIIQYPSSLTPEACQSIIEAVRPRLTPAKVGRGRARAVHPARVADNYKFREDEEWTYQLRSTVASLAGSPDIDFVEPVEVVCYPTGGFFYRHLDSAIGDRTHTFSIYLNNNYEGGELFFDKLGALYTDIPVGMGLLWENTNDMTHECRPVRTGEKWVVNVWANVMNSTEREFSGQDPLGNDADKFKDSPIIIPGEND